MAFYRFINKHYETSLKEDSERDLCSYSQNKKAVIIKKLVLFCIKEQDLIVEKIGKISALHQLYPYFLDLIKQDTILSNGMIYSGEISQNSKYLLLNSLKKWLQKNNVYLFIGSVNDIVEYLKNSSHAV